MEEDGSIFDLYFDLGHELDFKSDYLYHYRSLESLRSVFTEEGIFLRMTRADCFQDKLEGKIIEDYYGEALDDLLKQNIISQDDYRELRQVTFSSEELFVLPRKGPITFTAMDKYDVFVVCFSTVKCGPDMFKAYGNSGPGKYCLELHSSMLDALCHHDYDELSRTKLGRVLYGQEVVSYLKAIISSVMQQNVLRENKSMILADKLHELQYLAKDGSFNWENEVRLIAYLPREYEKERKLYRRIENDDKHLLLNLGCYAVCRYWSSEGNRPKDNEEFIAMLKERDYGYLIDE